MIYFYHISYDEYQDQFFAFVDDGSRHGKTIFSIDSTEELCDYIETGKMCHLDDTEGLENFLKEQALLQDDDTLMISEEMLW